MGLSDFKHSWGLYDLLLPCVSAYSSVLSFFLVLGKELPLLSLRSAFSLVSTNSVPSQFLLQSLYKAPPCSVMHL